MESNDRFLVEAAERALAKAHLTMDIGAIDALLHDDYILAMPGGAIETKREVIVSYKTGNRHWDKAEVCDLDVKVFGDMARVVGIWKAAGTNNGRPFDYQARFVSTWIKASGSWKNLSYASFEIGG